MDLYDACSPRARGSGLPQAHGQAIDDGVWFGLDYRPPLAWNRLIAYLVGRGAPGVEAVSRGRYMRTICMGSSKGWISVNASHDAPSLNVEITRSLAPAMHPLAMRLRMLFDLDAEPLLINTHLGADPRLALWIKRFPGLRVPGAFDGFELCVRAIIGQQVTVRAATTLFGRLAARFGEPIATPHPALSILAPNAHRMAEASLQSVVDLGITRRRAQTILAVASAVARGELNLEPGIDDLASIARLREIPGIGEWTASYVAMRALRLPDAFPHSDLGICKALGGVTPRSAFTLADRWRPWRSYAALHLWNSLLPEAVEQ